MITNRQKNKQHHYFRILPDYFCAIIKGDTTFAVSKINQNYQKYDILHLKEWDGNMYTGRDIVAEITCILDNPNYIVEGFVVMSIRVLDINIKIY